MISEALALATMVASFANMAIWGDLFYIFLKSYMTSKGKVRGILSAFSVLAFVCFSIFFSSMFMAMAVLFDYSLIAAEIYFGIMVTQIVFIAAGLLTVKEISTSY